MLQGVGALTYGGRLHEKGPAPRVLEARGLREKIFVLIRDHLAARGLPLRNGTIAGATIISAPVSTKNRERDPEMRSTRKGNRFFFGMKVHTGADLQGTVHSLEISDASVHDSQKMDGLLHGEERSVCGDKAHADDTRAADARRRGLKKARRGRPPSERERAFKPAAQPDPGAGGAPVPDRRAAVGPRPDSLPKKWRASSSRCCGCCAASRWRGSAATAAAELETRQVARARPRGDAERPERAPARAG